MHWLKPLSPRGEASAGDNNDTQVAWLRVQGEYVTQPQLIASRKMFAAHLDNISLSLAGYHVADYRFQDGSRLRIVSNSGIHQAVLWPAPAGEVLAYRGFVLRPTWIDGTDPTFDRNPILLRQGGAGPWAKWFSPYSPGDKENTPTYCVEDGRRTGGGRIRIVSDRPYYDVICLFDNKVYLNGQPKVRAPDATGMPIALHDPDVWFFSDDDIISHLDSGTVTDVFERSAEIVVISAGSIFEAATRYTPASRWLEYTTANLTTPGALQIWAVKVELLQDSPWVDVLTSAYGAFGIQAPLTTSGGPSFASEAIVEPMEPIPAEASITLSQFEWTSTSVNPFIDNQISGGPKVGPIGGPPSVDYTVMTYSDTFPESLALTLYDDWQATTERSVSINSITKWAELIPWYNTWSGTPVYRGAGFDEWRYYDWWYLPASLGAAQINDGDMVNPCATESQQSIEHTDTSFSMAKAGPETILRVDVGHTITLESSSGFYNYYEDVPASVSLGNNGSGIPPPPPYMLASPGTATDYAFEYFSRVTVFAVNGESKDFIYYDKANAVKLYLAATVESGITTAITGSTVTVASNVLTVNLVLQSPAGSSSVAVYSESQASAPEPPTRVPDDVDFGTLHGWDYVSLPRPDPIFAPLWQEQGLCPFIAYTTAAEISIGEPARLLAAFRLQFVQTVRGEGFPTPPDAEQGASVFRPYMLEQMLDLCWVGGAREVFRYIEDESFTLNAVYPASDLLTDLAIPNPSDSLRPNYYRT